ncbi:MAG: PAS domain-containing protein [Hoeflea sp.]|uniref:PAS domain-containing protein n=1 Tax=Hoeflea sp. TaxID=1940281 RepID=UPI001DA35719|nr:PAS domain-containing protein [Hoeflea sp.]MBU4530949.1 PAS domain-containing protein [Alphaproteobacteria bacterium]MBU4542724.1 PAS domain-containing protein [Alphaproteobacteria bacterium]MBU4549349.1 PAS domain-containing protein [Alphaproteobacteria bacterium]MBV1722841.1 PAS domain-containing protein [Hoeflea sp.]MBV1761563.1 PAS domain-containing protein [Hoeflea sp.]
MDTSLSAPLIFLDQDDLITGWSEGAKRLLGWDAGKVIGQPFSEIYDDRGFFISVDGPIDLDSVSVSTPDEGRVVALRNARTTHLLERLDLTMTNADVLGAWNWDVAGELIFTDSRFASSFGVDAHQAEHGLPLEDFINRIHEDDRARVAAEMIRTIESGGAYAAEYRMLRPGGEVCHVLAQGKLVDGNDGKPVRFPGVLFDVTARRQAEMEAQAQKERFRTLFENLDSGFCIIRMIWDEAGNPVDYEFIEVNKAFARHTGIEDAVGKRIRRDVAAGHEQHWFDLYGKVARTGEPVSIEYPADALNRWYQVQAFAIDSDGSDTVAVLFNDISVSKRAEMSLKASEEEFRTLAQSMLNHVWTATPDGMIDWLNDQVVAFSGEARESLHGDAWSAIVHPDDFPGAAAAWSDAIATGETYQTEFRIRRHDGAYRWHVVRATPVKTEEGVIRRWVGTNTDIEHAKLNEAALAELNATLEDRIAERTEQLLQSEKALQQSQKMETIGKLTGGIAHDFNNLLQVVSGNLQLLAKDVAGNDRAEGRVANALAGVERGAKLASQLLAFGRRQPLEPKVINVGRFVSGVEDLVCRSVGEAVDCEIIVSEGLWNTSADPTQVETTLLNLAINARDAMEGAGKLTIEAANASLDDSYTAAHDDVSCGDYVMIAVSDTGSGMDRATLERVFEPFFSTKPEGKGTGLGLSMVYGFVKQSGGHIKIYSEPGHGTTVKLYLPRSLDAEHQEINPVQVGPATGGSETVLVVEDDDDVRATVVATLNDLGYHVLTARDAQSGLAVIESGINVDVLFTDVVMPGQLKSPEMAKIAQALRPGLVVLFTSGYTENSIVHGGKLDPGVELLSKPYTREALDSRIRHLLANKKQRRAPAAKQNQPSPAAQQTHPASVAPAASTANGALTIILVEDEALIRINTADILADMGHKVIEAGTAAEALEAAETQEFDILVTDLGLPDMKGGDLARQVRQLKPAAGIIFATGQNEIPDGADADAVLLKKPYTDDALRQALDQVR